MGSQTPRNVTHAPAKQAETYEKRRRAAELRRAGWTWDAIAEEVGYSSRGPACNAVKALLQEHQSLAYDEIALYRQESLDRLTDLLKVAMGKALDGDEKMMREARLIISQIGDLTGEKAPLQVQIGDSDVDRLLREALDEFRRRTAQLDRKAGADPGRAAQDG
jgi:hypothetical protein